MYIGIDTISDDFAKFKTSFMGLNFSTKNYTIDKKEIECMLIQIVDEYLSNIMLDFAKRGTTAVIVDSLDPKNIKKLEGKKIIAKKDKSIDDIVNNEAKLFLENQY